MVAVMAGDPLHIIAVEANAAAIELLAVAVERNRPGTRLTFVPNLEAAASAAARANRGGTRAPQLVMIGPCAFAQCSHASVVRLRNALPEYTRVVAQEWPSEWQAFSAAVAAVMASAVRG
jgi:hypothetical protein